jgi:hypothetical protein
MSARRAGRVLMCPCSKGIHGKCPLCALGVVTATTKLVEHAGPRTVPPTTAGVACRQFFQFPYSSGRSRHGEPVRVRHSTPLITRRWSCSWPPRGACFVLPHRK